MKSLDANLSKYRNGWASGLPETPCGYGSKLTQTKIQSKWIPKIVKKYRIKSIADIGAGDLQWIKRIDLGCEYTPYDLVPRHPDVIEFNLLVDELPQVDCLMVLWVINHMPEHVAKFAINKLVNSGSKYLLYIYSPRMWDFSDLESIDRIVIRQGDVELRLIKL